MGDFTFRLTRSLQEPIHWRKLWV